MTLAADDMYLVCILVPGMRRRSGKLRKLGAATLQLGWNVEHISHAFLNTKDYLGE